MPFSHAYEGKDAPTLYIIAVVSNPVRFSIRYKLYEEFRNRMRGEANVKLIEVEHAFGNRPFEITDANNPDHIQLRGGPEYELWLKEPMINRGFRHLYEKYPDWEYAAWVDADVEFTRKDWVLETIEALQHYKVVQPWSHAVDFGPNHEIMAKPSRSFLSCFVEKIQPLNQYGGEYWHAGYAWAIRRDAMDHLGKLIDWCIIGSGDHHMAHAFCGNIWKGVHGEMGTGYKVKAAEFQKLCDTFIKQDVGYVPGTLLHHFHGSKVNRNYVNRWKILVDNSYDPNTDIMIDKDGLPFLVGNKTGMRDGLRQYFRARNEDDLSWE